MAIDRELYRQAYEGYRQWNEAELIERARNANKLTPQQAWRQYAELWEFIVKISPEISAAQRRLRLADLEEYLSKIQKLESWRRSHELQS